MNANQQTELKLVEAYDQELADFLLKWFEVDVGGKESYQRFLKDLQRKIDIFEKQVLNYKQLFKDDKDVQFYESRILFFRGMFKICSSWYYDLFPGIFSPSKYGELRAALKLFDQSLQISEQPNTRSMKVFCYRQLGDNESALQELDYILEFYADNEEVYLHARKEKDELEFETRSSSGIWRLLRSIFG